MVADTFHVSSDEFTAAGEVSRRGRPHGSVNNQKRRGNYGSKLYIVSRCVLLLCDVYILALFFFPLLCEVYILALLFFPTT